MIFRFLGGGAAPFITTETKLCQSLIPHAKFVWRAHIVVEIAYDNEVVKMNEQFINISREVVGEHGVCHRWGSVGTHKCPLPATNRSFNDNALNVCEL